MKAAEQMSLYLRTGKRLKKMRRRYIRAIAPAIAVDHNLLWKMPKLMKERGLYSTSTFDRDIRFYILRGMHWLDGCRRGTTDWSQWLLKNGWGKTWWQKAA